MQRLTLALFALCCLLLGPARSVAQETIVDELFPGTNRIAEVPAPDRFFTGFGRSYVEYHRAYEYARAIAAVSGRVIVEDYGRTETGRLLLKAVVTSRANHGRRQAVRDFNGGLMNGTVSEIGDQPATVWLGLAIHGDEGSAVEAGIALLYHLASDNGDEVKRILDNVITVIDICTNPDGRARFTSGVRDRLSSPVSESRHAYDHRQPWPGGRTNHYMFDLNRDWHLQTQRESRLRAVQFLKDKPQVLADLHEMGSDSEYYFSTPPGQPVNQHVGKAVEQGWDMIGKAISSEFDKRKWPYWTGDVFPGDYPGYGGLWPCLFGCVGMTFEQAASKAGRVGRRDGGVMTLEKALSHHAAAAHATVRVCAEKRREVLERYRDHFKRVKEEGKKDALPWFVMTPRHDKGRLLRLGETLASNGVRVQAFERAQVLETQPLIGGPASSVTVPAGSLAVSSQQPLRPLVLSLLDPTVIVDPEFLKAEAERLEKGRRSEFYDISAWNLALLFGVETFRVAEVPQAVLSDDWIKPSPGAENPAADPKTVAVLIPGQRLGSSALLAGLLAKGIPVEMAPFEFTIHGRSFGRGTLIVHVGKLDEAGLEALTEVAASASGSLSDLFFPVTSYTTDTGHDLGLNRVRSVTKPRIIVACGRGVRSYSFGAVRWLFERGLDRTGRFHVEHTSVPIDGSLGRTLEDANVLVLPDGSGYKDKITKKMLDTFLERGGTVVALRGALSFLTEKEMGHLVLKKQPEDKVRGLGSVPGPILRADLDSEHWLGHGLTASLAVQCRASTWWMPPEKKDGTIVMSYSKDLSKPLSGILPEKKGALLAGAPILIEKVHGRGRVVAFTEDVVFRGASPGLWKLFLNACLLGPTMSR